MSGPLHILRGKGTCMGSMPVGVESVSKLPFQGPALRGQWPVTPSPCYLHSSRLVTAEWAGSAAETEFSI